MQTCRHHPDAGRFLATCPGCAQELHDIEARNRAQAQAHAALRGIGMTGVEILSVQAIATPDYIEVHIPIEATGQQAAAKRGDRLYVWPAADGMRWEIRPPGQPQGQGEELPLQGPHYVYLVAEIDHLLNHGNCD